MINYITSVFSRTASVVRAVLGVPDYQRYLSHMRSAHPGAAIATIWRTRFKLLA
jgi:uncharacterized short protein YbdD (DUF466 family)